MSWWNRISIHELDYAALEDWSLWLSDRGLKPKSRRNIIGVFRSFIGWMFKRGGIREMPRDIPWPKVSEHSSTMISPRTQQEILKKIPVIITVHVTTIIEHTTVILFTTLSVKGVTPIKQSVKIDMNNSPIKIIDNAII